MPSSEVFLAEPLVVETRPRDVRRCNAAFFVAVVGGFACGVLLCSQVSVGGNREPAITSAWGAYVQPRNAVYQPMQPVRAGRSFMHRFSMLPLRAEAASATTSSKAQEKLKALWESRSDDFASFPVKALRPITVQGANVPAGATGSLKGGLIRWDDGFFSEDKTRPVTKSIGSQDCVGVGSDYVLEKVVTEKPATDAWPENLGQEVPEADLNKAFSDLSGMAPGDTVAVKRSDGKWTYAVAVGKQGNSRSGTGVGVALTFQVGPKATKTYSFNEWDMVKQLKEPGPDTAWKMSFPKDAGEALTNKLDAETKNPLMSKIGEPCSEMDLIKASSDLSNVVSGDVVATLRSDGTWRYARVLQFIGSNRDAKGIKFGNPAEVTPGMPGVGILLRVDGDGSEKKVLSSEFEKVKAIS